MLHFLLDGFADLMKPSLTQYGKGGEGGFEIPRKA